MPFPWPARSDRHRAIAEARAEKERSRAGAARTALLTAEIKRMAADNHFAEAVARDLIARHRGEPG